MEETISDSVDFDEFMSGFGADDGYQTDSTEETETTEAEETEESTEEATEEEAPEDSESEETEEDETASEDEENGSEGEQEADEPDSEQMFTIKVNKEQKQVSLEEMTALAQKGSDYDRIKGKLADSEKHSQELADKLSRYQGAMEVLENMAAEANMDVDALVHQVNVNWLKQTKGYSDAEAEANIRAAKAERELKSYKDNAAEQKATETNDENRASREVAEFRKKYPNVELTKELLGELMDDVKAGKTLTEAYQNKENARKDAEIKELKAKLEAEKQNKKNKTRSLGSQNDSGGRRVRSEFDDFVEAFR